MGILEKDGWDVFSSYSSLDNDLHRNWVKDFSDALKQRVQLELTHKQCPVDLDELAFFFDKESMPANGPLENELNDKVKASHFLLLFVGDHYLQSVWCGKELSWFSERFSGLQDAALKNVFLIMLTPGAVREAAKKAYLSTIRSRGIYQLAYLPPGKSPMPPQLRNKQDMLGNNPDYDELVDKLATTLAERIIEQKQDNAEKPSPGPPPGDPVVTFGIVASGLKDYRSQLAARVAEKFNIKVDCWEWDDLGRGPEELAERLANAKIFVQLIDKTPIGLAGGPQPGGIFALQKDLVPENVPLLWIEPTDCDKPAQEEHSQLHSAFLNPILANALKLSAEKSLEELAEKLQSGGRPKYAKIMIEHSEEDQEEVFQVHKVINDAWNDVSEQSLPLRLRGAEWAEIRTAPEKLKSYHGIVLVDRSRPYVTLENQLDDIEDELANRNQELAIRTFVLPPKSKPTILSRQFIRFQKGAAEGPMEVFTLDALKKFLENVKARALSVSAER